MDIWYKIRRIIFKFFPHFMKSSDYVQWLEHNGIHIGKGTYFFGPSSTQIDIQRPWMLHIGEYCKITSNVTILCHDYSRSVLRRVYGEVIGESKETFIGDNVFIGINSTILMGAHIGNNTIVGAGSVVGGFFPDNVVIAGNPAKIIRTIDEHYNIRKNKEVKEAVKYVWNFRKYYGRFPSEKEMGPFWQLFMPRNIEVIKDKKIFLNLSGDETEEILKDFIMSMPKFDGYDSFIKYCVENSGN